METVGSGGKRCVVVTQSVLCKADCRLNGQPFVLRHQEELRLIVSCVTRTLLSLMGRRFLFDKCLLACSVDLRVGRRTVLCGRPCTDVSPFNTNVNWLMQAQSLCARYRAWFLFRVGVQVPAAVASDARRQYAECGAHLLNELLETDVP
jgi:hypothetical protein